ncbi:hypothetical protein NESM_000834900 [Novymonas esmeraldas]|uniref:Uncharacterized protein n=1 Tax=Novymonas esmeraldas TaxID=1808958 RepID=A0AAW0EZH0_9TRYP
MNAAVSVGSPPAPTASSCTIFPTESEDYYCLSCNTRCSGLGLLVGPHTSHDYLPLSDALLYMPAAILREARDVAHEVEESFMKPWRVQEQQREDTLLHLLDVRRSRLAALAQLVVEVQQMDQRLLCITEGKALDVANWRYQQRGLQRRIEKLHRGATTLASCFAPSSTAAAADATGARVRSSSEATGPSWLHTQCVAQKELAQARRLLQTQLAQLDEAAAASSRRLETWHRLLRTEAPDDDDDGGGYAAAAAASNAEGSPVESYTRAPDAATGMIHTPVHDPPPPPYPPRPCNSLRHAHAHAHLPTAAAAAAAAVAPKARSPPEAALTEQREYDSSQPPPRHSSPGGRSPPPAAHRPPHPSDAEVLLLQHALHNINDKLRQRLLHAAAASLASSSSSVSSTRSPLANARGAAVAVALPPMPEATPLRNVRDPMATADAATRALTHANATACVRPSAESPAMDWYPRGASPPPRGADVTPPTVTAIAAAEDVVCDVHEDPRRVRWQSLCVRERQLKESLDQLLRSGVATSSSSSREHPCTTEGGEGPTSALCSSIPALPRSLSS